MPADINTRGRAYQCRTCPKVLRKDRMISHVLKHHVAMDRVPYSCTLCKFTCLDRDTLLHHIDNYKRHVDAEAQLEERPNYADILKRALDPYQVDEKDMVPLSKEASRQWWKTRCGRSYQVEDPFEDDDDDDDEPGVMIRGGKLFPAWMFESENLPSTSVSVLVPTYQPTHLNKIHSDSSATQQGQVHYTTPLMTSRFSSVDTTVAFQQPILSFAQVSHQAPYPQQTLAAASSTSQLPLLNTPLLCGKSPVVNTPCLDENTVPLITAQEATNLEVRSEEPVTKRAKTCSTQTSTPHGDISEALWNISKSIDQGFQSIVLALDSTTRAVRCKDKTLDKIVTELDRVARKLGEKKPEKSQTKRV